MLPTWIVLDPLLDSWLQEDIGRGDRTTQALLNGPSLGGSAALIAKQAGIIAGLPLFERVFQRLEQRCQVQCHCAEGTAVKPGTTVATLDGSLATILTGERVALNLVMKLSGIATLTDRYAQTIADLPAQLVDTRKTTPGLRLVEKYATALGGAQNHRFGLDDALMIKDNHIAAAGSIAAALKAARQLAPYPLSIEVETENLAQVDEAIAHGADIIMLDNMSVADMKQAVTHIRQASSRIKIEASGNITLSTLRQVAETGVDYISTSATITQASWLDFSLRIAESPSLK